MAQPWEIQKKQYKKLVDEIKPRPPLIRNTLGAFIFGGLIALIGQFLLNFFQGQGLTINDAGAATSTTLIFFAALFTGLGIYDEMAKYGGAGTIVPITGFANSMVAPAMEYRTEGFVLGVGAKLFTIAGPVLVFGIFTAWIVAILYYLFR